jgi:hypothetical protein
MKNAGINGQESLNLIKVQRDLKGIKDDQFKKLVQQNVERDKSLALPMHDSDRIRKARES